ncbi:MAG: thiamine phosphate synthase [Acidobacteriota bacterium]
MIRCYITDRRGLAGPVLDAIARNLQAGVEWIQIREKDLSACELFSLVRAAKGLPNPAGTQFIVNSRVDVALAAGAHGAHMPAGSPECRRWRGIVPSGFLLGVSCHTVEEVAASQAEGAAYVLFGPVFAPVSKTSAVAPRGIDGLRRAVGATNIPVLALGGITENSVSACVKAGAAGVAGISLFQNMPSAC